MGAPQPPHLSNLRREFLLFLFHGIRVTTVSPKTEEIVDGGGRQTRKKEGILASELSFRKSTDLNEPKEASKIWEVRMG